MRNKLMAAALMVVASASTIASAQDLPSRNAPPPAAGPGTKVGVLNCNLAPAVGLIIAGAQRMSCRFTADAPAAPEFYAGTLNTVGVDLGFTAGGKLAWAVFAPTNQMMPGSLTGTYVGASGNVGVGLGLGENFLLGGSNNSVALQPWSVEGTSGLNVSGGLSSLELRPE